MNYHIFIDCTDFPFCPIKRMIEKVTKDYSEIENCYVWGNPKYAKQDDSLTFIDYDFGNYRESLIDTQMALKITSTLYKEAKKGDIFVIFAEDDDFEPVIRAIKEEGFEVLVFTKKDVSGSLWRG